MAPPKFINAVHADRCGGSEVLVAREISTPHLRPGYVLVRLESIGVNYADLMCRRGAHPGMPSPPIVLGCEGAGRVEVCGSDVTLLREGDRVGVYSPWGGTYATYIAVPQTYALPLPRSMSYDEAAAFTHVYLTAYHALRTLGRAQSGQWLLVTAAAGGLGTALMQLGNLWELRIIGCVGSKSKFHVLERLGITHRLCYGSGDLSRGVKEITHGHGIDISVETVGGELFGEVIESLAPLGRIVLAGIAGGERPHIDVDVLLSRSATCSTLNLSVMFAWKPKLIRQSWIDLIDLYSEQNLRPIIGHRFPLARVREAHDLMESRQSIGKILLSPNSF